MLASPRAVPLKPVVRHITNENEFQAALHLSETMFVFIDVHEEWCGPVKALIPYYNQLWIDVDEAAKRIHLASISKADEDLIKKLKVMITDVDFDDGCRPLFLILRNGSVVAHVDGVNQQSIDSYVKMFLPEYKKFAVEA